MTGFKIHIITSIKTIFKSYLTLKNKKKVSVCAEVLPSFHGYCALR